MRAAARGLAMLALVLVACDSESPPSQIVVAVHAAPEVRARATALRLRVDPDGDGERFEQTRELGTFEWPARTTIVPRDGDAARTYRVEALALDERGAVIVTARAISGFVQGETRELALYLDAACLGAPACDEDETCEAGECVSARVAASALPPFGTSGDAGARDGGRRDAAAGDGGVAPVDGGVDACTPAASYADEDGDGYGDPATFELSCALEAGRVGRGGDCDDACERCRPDGVEVCDGTRDEDCDGTADEGCVCSAGASRACPTGSDTGECSAGTQACAEGVWGACSGRIDPLPETCDGRDEDCDGRVDEGVTRACESDCGFGTESCRAGEWSACTARAPRDEICNAMDDDCDGTTDEGVLSRFFRDADADGFGSPTEMTLACRAPPGYVADDTDCDDACGACRPGASEACDGSRDENCDGSVDELCMCTTGASRSCPDGIDTGACVAGAQRCADGVWGDCAGQVEPVMETCNGIDDDCDARVDEGVERACGPETELGICQRGTQTCSAGGWSTCRGAILPAVESCNGMDDDCDGATDEGVRTVFYADGDGDGFGREGSTMEACARPSGFSAIADDCDDARADVHPGAREVCDGVDQDCDARIDEGASCGSDAGPPDAGPGDAGAPVDAGVPSDAGVSSDAGVEADSGASSDAGG